MLPSFACFYLANSNERQIFPRQHVAHDFVAGSPNNRVVIKDVPLIKGTIENWDNALFRALYCLQLFSGVTNPPRVIFNFRRLPVK
jgi:hypothetical protein